MSSISNKSKSNYILLILIVLLCNVSLAQNIKIGKLVFTTQQIQVGVGESAIATSDFNSDGHQDVVFVNQSKNNFILFQGDGTGKLIKSKTISAGENPTGVTTADINNDGNIDLIIANHETSYITLLLGDGQGNFHPAKNSPLVINVKPHPHIIRAKDIDGDNITDLILDNRDHEGLLFLKGLADGNFETGKLIKVGGDPYRSFAMGDINKDGLVDIVTPNRTEVGIMIQRKSKDLSFTKNKLVTSQSPFAVELTDINADGNLDLIVASTEDLVEIIPGSGTGDFNYSNKTVINMARGAKDIAVGDINGDGIMDAVVSNWSTHILVILGSKNKFESYKIEVPNISNPWGIALADLNKDNKCDIIIADGVSDKAVLFVSISE